MHTREDIKLLAEQCLEALLAFMAGINFNASILYHSQFIL